MTRAVSPAIHDILETIQRVQGKVAGKTFAEFEADWEFRFAIQRAIEIISEATRRIPDEFKELRPEIRWSSIAGIGNVASRTRPIKGGDRGHRGERQRAG